jgi:alkanesulfonate monooxygenase SsuD/methylene tetrahydromethanopterin reductase-like flavin-dependent oxidoreductase (luciferase family)
VLLVAQHDPITLAKQIATLDNLSAGRFVLGIGYGWNASEMADHGVDYRQRRQVTREKMLCMEALWSPDEVSEYHGELVDVDACYTWPKPVSQPRPTTMIGAAAGPKTFADIAAFADGWMPIGGAGIAAELPKLRQAFEEAGRDPDTVQIAPFGVVPTEEKLEYYASLGVTEAVLRVPGGSADEMLRVLDGHTKYAAIASGGAG